MRHVDIQIFLLRVGHLVAWGGKLTFLGHEKSVCACSATPSFESGQVKAISDLLGQLKYPVDASVTVFGENITCTAVSEVLSCFGQHQIDVVGVRMSGCPELEGLAKRALAYGTEMMAFGGFYKVMLDLVNLLQVTDPFVCFTSPGGDRFFIDHTMVFDEKPCVCSEEVQCNLFG